MLTVAAGRRAVGEPLSGFTGGSYRHLDETGVAAMRDGGTVGVAARRVLFSARDAAPAGEPPLRRYQPVAVASDFQSRHQPVLQFHAGDEYGLAHSLVRRRKRHYGRVVTHAPCRLARWEAHRRRMAAQAGYRADFVVWDAEQPVDSMSQRNPFYISGYTEDKSHDAMVMGFGVASAILLEAPMRGVCLPSRAARPFPRAAKDRVNGICLRRGVKRTVVPARQAARRVA